MIKRLSRELSAWMIEFCRWAPSGIGQCLRLKSYAKRLKKGGNNCYIGPGTSISGWENISLENNVSIGQNCILSSSEGALSIGNNTGLNSNVTLGADLGSIYIGKNVIIGMNTVMRAANHRFDQSPDVPIRDQGHDRGTIVIHDDVWIGANVTIVPNVTIGSHCVIGAGSVVTKDIPTGTMAVGVPARVLKSIEKNK
jgi:acetyltransferase-like isoleucine patch superfamily enzyme